MRNQQFRNGQVYKINGATYRVLATRYKLIFTRVQLDANRCCVAMISGARWASARLAARTTTVTWSPSNVAQLWRDSPDS